MVARAAAWSPPCRCMSVDLGDPDPVEGIGEIRNRDVVTGDVDSTAFDRECVGRKRSGGRCGSAEQEPSAGDVKGAHYAQGNTAEPGPVPVRHLPTDPPFR